MSKKLIENINSNDTKGCKIYPEDGDWKIDENGKRSFGADGWCYCNYFEDNIHIRMGDLADGLSLYSFASRWESNITNKLCDFQDFVNRFPILEYQLKMEKKGARLNAWAFFTLCNFINDIIHEKKVVLLMPTIQDLAEQIGNVCNIELSNEEGEKISTSHPELLDTINNILKEKKEGESTVYLYKLVDRQEIYTLETLQVEFAYYFSDFFNQYFKIERKNNGLLCKFEQELLSACLKYFNLSSVEVTGSRFRQLKMQFENLFNNRQIFTVPKDNEGGTMSIQTEFIKYKDWKTGKINLLKQSLSPIECGVKIHFTIDFFKSVAQCYNFQDALNDEDSECVNSPENNQLTR